VRAGFHRILEFAAEIKIKKDRDFKEFEGKTGLNLSSSKEWTERSVDIHEPLDSVEL
jgi:hypothetical protein